MAATTIPHDVRDVPHEARERDPSVPEHLRIDLPIFRGPYDELLEEVRADHIDLFEIPLALITATYLTEIADLESLDLAIGGEWLELTGTLVYLKSRKLLPPEPDEEDPADGPDPRQELMRRIREYKRFRSAAEALRELPRLDRDVFTRPVRPILDELEPGPPRLQEASLVDLMEAVQQLVDRKRVDADSFLRVDREELTIRSVIIEIAGALAERPRMAFEELFEDVAFTRYRVVTTFLALLEMTRLDMIRLMQARLDDGRLYIERSVIDIVEITQELDLPEARPGA
jgi:segregation and condensation protein A